MGELRIMSAKGDETIEWDPADEQQTAKARQAFEGLLAKGFKAYELVSQRGREVTEFRPDLGKLLMAPAAAPAMAGGPVSSAARL